MAKNLIIEENGKMRKKEDIDLVEQAIKLKNKGELWLVIDLLLKVIMQRDAENMKALQLQIADQKEMLTDKEFGTTEGGKDFDRRLTVIFPLKLQQMLRALYSVEELPMDAKFYREFLKRYPNFKIAEKQ